MSPFKNETNLQNLFKIIKRGQVKINLTIWILNKLMVEPDGNRGLLLELMAY